MKNRRQARRPNRFPALIDAIRDVPESAAHRPDDHASVERRSGSHAAVFSPSSPSLARQHGLTKLSMGMSHDLEAAIEEGATHIRVGTALFGPRTKES